MNPITTCPKDGSVFILIDEGYSYPAFWAPNDTYPLRFIDDWRLIRLVSPDLDGDFDGVITNGYKPPFDESSPLKWLPWPEFPSQTP